MKKNINSKYFYFIIIFLFMIIFNFLTSYIQDDYWYMYDYSGNHRIGNIIDIIVSLKNMYFNWGGRVFAHFFAYTFLMLPKWIFNIINSIIYVLNIYLIYLISRGKRKDNYKYLLLIHMIMFIFFPVFGQVFLWLDGSCNYSFTLCIQLFFIYKILNIKSKNNYFIYILISLLAGMCNENSSLSLIVFLILYMVYDRSNLKLKIASLISLIIGYLFLFLAPGNYKRMEMISGKTSFFYHFFDKVFYLISSFWPIILGILLLVIIFMIKNKKEGKLCLIYYLSSLVAFFSMIASPQLLVRSFTISVIYIFIIFMIFIFNINKDIYKRIIYVILSIFFILVIIPTTKDYLNYFKFMNNRYELIDEAKNRNQKRVILEKYRENGNCRIPVGCDVPDIYDNWDDTTTNYFMSKYYGIKIYGK